MPISIQYPVGKPVEPQICTVYATYRPNKYWESTFKAHYILNGYKEDDSQKANINDTYNCKHTKSV